MGQKRELMSIFEARSKNKIIKFIEGNSSSKTAKNSYNYLVNKFIKNAVQR